MSVYSKGSRALPVECPPRVLHPKDTCTAGERAPPSGSPAEVCRLCGTRVLSIYSRPNFFFREKMRSPCSSVCKLTPMAGKRMFLLSPGQVPRFQSCRHVPAQAGGTRWRALYSLSGRSGMYLREMVHLCGARLLRFPLGVEIASGVGEGMGTEWGHCLGGRREQMREGRGQGEGSMAWAGYRDLCLTSPPHLHACNRPSCLSWLVSCRSL